MKGIWIGLLVAALAVLVLAFVVTTWGGDESFVLAALGLWLLAGGVWAAARIKKESL